MADSGTDFPVVARPAGKKLGRKRSTRPDSQMICLERPTGWWVTLADDPSLYVSGPSATKSFAEGWIVKSKSRRFGEHVLG